MGGEERERRTAREEREGGDRDAREERERRQLGERGVTVRVSNLREISVEFHFNFVNSTKEGGCSPFYKDAMRIPRFFSLSSRRKARSH